LKIESESVDLVVVAQALHWFDLSKFLAELNRVLHPGGTFAFSAYGPFMICKEFPEATKLLAELHLSVASAFLDPQSREFFNTHYKDIQLPANYSPIKREHLLIERLLTCDEIISFVDTWASLNAWRVLHKEDPLPSFKPRLLQALGNPKNHSQFHISWELTLNLTRKQATSCLESNE